MLKYFRRSFWMDIVNGISIIYVELSFGFRARDDSSLAFAIMMFNKGCIYIKLYFFTKFDKQLVYRLTEITNNK